MEGPSATMPRTKYRALDFQQLTLASRSTSPTSTHSPERREAFWPDFSGLKFLCNRGRASSHLFTSDQHPLELPVSYIPKPASRPVLEQLRFGSLELAFDTDSTNATPLPAKTAEARIFLESDFPPLQQSPPTPPIFVDSGFERRRATFSEAHQQRCLYRTSSAPISDSRTRSRKPTLRSTRYRDGGIDSQGTRQESLAPVGFDQSDSVDATVKHLRKDSILPPVEAEKRRFRNDMASAFPQMSGDARRHYPSGTPRYENRPPVNRATPCKNGPLCRKFQEGWTPCPL